MEKKLIMEKKLMVVSNNQPKVFETFGEEAKTEAKEFFKFLLNDVSAAFYQQLYYYMNERKKDGATIEETLEAAKRQEERTTKALKLKPNKQRGVKKPRWTWAEDQTIKAMYGKTRNENLAKTFGRSVQAVNARAHTLGITKRRKVIQ